LYFVLRAYSQNLSLSSKAHNSNSLKDFLNLKFVAIARADRTSRSFSSQKMITSGMTNKDVEAAFLGNAALNKFAPAVKAKKLTGDQLLFAGGQTDLFKRATDELGLDLAGFLELSRLCNRVVTGYTVGGRKKRAGKKHVHAFGQPNGTPGPRGAANVMSVGAFNQLFAKEQTGHLTVRARRL
jgi:hypothetical protein